MKGYLSRHLWSATLTAILIAGSIIYADGQQPARTQAYRQQHGVNTGYQRRADLNCVPVRRAAAGREVIVANDGIGWVEEPNEALPYMCSSIGNGNPDKPEGDEESAKTYVLR